MNGKEWWHYDTITFGKYDTKTVWHWHYDIDTITLWNFDTITLWQYDTMTLWHYDVTMRWWYHGDCCFSWPRDCDHQWTGAAPLQWPRLPPELLLLGLRPARQTVLVEGREEDQAVQPQGQYRQPPAVISKKSVGGGLLYILKTLFVCTLQSL